MADASQPVTHTLEWWALRPEPHVIDTVRWTPGTTIEYQTGVAHDQFTTTAQRHGGAAEAFAMLSGWSNGYVAIFPPGEAPWHTDPATDSPA